MNQYNSDKKHNSIYVIICTLAIIAIHVVPFIIGHPYAMVNKRLFWSVDVGLLLVFSGIAIANIVQTKQGGADNWIEVTVWISTLAIIAWVLGWNHAS